MGLPMGPTGHALCGGRPPKPRCHRPVTPQEPHQCLGDDTNLCLGCQVEVELCHSHHHLRGDTCLSHSGHGDVPGDSCVPQCPTQQYPEETQPLVILPLEVPSKLSQHPGGSLADGDIMSPGWTLLVALGTGRGLTAALRLCSRGLVLRRSRRWSGSMT